LTSSFKKDEKWFVSFKYECFNYACAKEGIT
jgi:hypothetical protein